MDRYSRSLEERDVFLTPEEARERMDMEKDLLVMVDHSVPEISSAADFLDEARRIAVIDHHRRGIPS